MQPIHIPINKGKHLLMILGCIAFVLICVASYSSSFDNVRRILGMRYFVAPLGILLFGVMGIPFLCYRIISGSKGLMIDQAGVTFALWNNTFIPWTNISHYTVVDVSGTKIIYVHLNQPQTFGKKPLKSITISANILSTNHDTLYQWLEYGLAQSRGVF